MRSITADRCRATLLIAALAVPVSKARAESLFTLLNSPTSNATVARGFGAGADTWTGMGWSSGSPRGEVWRNGTVTLLENPPDGTGEVMPYGISADGSVVVGYAGIAGGNYEACRWDDGSPTGLGFLFAGPDTGSYANDVTADGTVIVGSAYYVDSSTGDWGGQAFRWEGGVMTGLETVPGAKSSYAADITPDGTRIVGSILSPNRQEACIWTNGVLAPLGGLSDGWLESWASSASDDGTTIVGIGVRSDGWHFVRWAGNQIESIGDLDESLTDGLPEFHPRVSGDGSRIIGTSFTAVGTRNWISVDGSGPQDFATYISLHYGLGGAISGLSIAELGAISPDGRSISGRCYDADSHEYGFIAYLDPADFTAVPEIDPAGAGAAFALLASAMGIVERRRRGPRPGPAGYSRP